LRIDPTRKVTILNDFPIGTLIISSPDNFEIYKTIDFRQVHTLILTSKKEDKEFYAKVMEQFKDLFSPDKFPNLKIIILCNLYISSISPPTFSRLKIDYVRMNDCYLEHVDFPRFGSIGRLDIHQMKIRGTSVVVNDVKKCRIIISEAYYFLSPYGNEVSPTIKFVSKEFTSLEVRCVSNYELPENKHMFMVHLPYESCLTKLIWKVKRGGLYISNFEHLLKLKEYYGENPSKVKINCFNANMGSSQVFYLQSMLSSKTEIHIQEEVNSINGKPNITQEEVDDIEENPCTLY